MKSISPLFGYISITVALALSILTGSAQGADYTRQEFSHAYQEYLNVSADQGGSAKKLAQQWQTLLAQDESDPFTLVMLGSSHSLMGRDAMMPWSKMRNTETGLDEMALAQRLLTAEHDHQYFEGMPISLHVKTKAAITFIHVPEFFGRFEDGYYLFEDVLSDPIFIQLPAAMQTHIFYYGIEAAYALDKKAQAAIWQQQLKQLNVNDDYTSAALELGGEL